MSSSIATVTTLNDCVSLWTSLINWKSIAHPSGGLGVPTLSLSLVFRKVIGFFLVIFEDRNLSILPFRMGTTPSYIVDAVRFVALPNWIEIMLAITFFFLLVLLACTSACIHP